MPDLSRVRHNDGCVSPGWRRWLVQRMRFAADNKPAMPNTEPELLGSQHNDAAGRSGHGAEAMRSKNERRVLVKAMIERFKSDLFQMTICC